MKAARPEQPRQRGQTVRQAILQALREQPLSARELSARVSISERDVAAHIEHLERSLARTTERLSIEPPTCQSCGFVFESRERRSRPSRCPRCRKERISPAIFSVTAR